MPIPQSGPVSFSQIAAEVGASATGFNLASSTNARRLAGILTGTINAGACRGGVFLAASENAISLFSKAGSPGSAGNWRFVVDGSAVIGSTSATVPALTFGDFVAGSMVIVENYGTVQGAGGVGGTSGVGGQGGSAIAANTSTTYTKTINNYGTVRGGGGGGGKGGPGGVGGTGGQGLYYTTGQEGPTGTAGVTHAMQSHYAVAPPATANPTGPFEFKWGNVVKGTGSNGFQPGDGYTYYTNGTHIFTTTQPDADGYSYFYYYYQVYRTYPVANYSSGGAGGGGGTGGNGGRGLGHDGAAATGLGGSAGSMGAAGGTNAGAGGQGGTGGTGGTGGGWGAAGSIGATGAIGNTGASGNYSAGVSGAVGAAGSAAGAAGYYLYRNGTTVTFNNSGTVNGQNG